MPSIPALPGRGGVPHVLDTLSGALQPSARGAAAGLYVCGITPYDATHLGHAKTYLTFDTLLRAWRDAGLATHYAQNVTDVDDPLLERATDTGAAWQELAAGQVSLFRSDMTALRVLPPDAFISVVDTVPDVVTAVEHLIEQGAAYRVGVPDAGGHGALDVYADLGADKHFGELSQLSKAEMLAQFALKGGDPDRAGKRNRLDALLWRAARPGEPSWPGGTLGEGRPGWHIECAVIARDHLHLPFDVLGGGSDLVFPHHEMSRAHLRALTDVVEPARLEVHTAMVGWQGEKMSKSRGNLVFVSRLLAGGMDPGALRLALLNQSFRADWEWQDSLGSDAAHRLERWRAAARRPAGKPGATDHAGVAGEAVVAQMRQAIANDLDTRGAIAAVDTWAGGTLERGFTAEQGAGAVVAAAVDALLGVDLLA